jgi:hypothetical protein
MSVRNALVLFLALSALSLLVGCGSSSPHVAPSAGGSFGVSNLKGTYVISMAGEDLNVAANSLSYFAIVGTITADGAGNITGGTVDINDPNLSAVPALGQTLIASKYTLGTDGRGTGTLNTPEGIFGLDFVLTSNGHGLITRFDNGGSGSGTIDIQGSASQSGLTTVAFSLSGTDATSSFLLGSVGAASLDSSGNIQAASTQDFNESTSVFADLPLSGSVVLTSSTSGTATLTTSSIFGTLAFDVWVVDSTHLKLIETDTGAVLVGDAYTQTATSTPNATLVFTLEGLDSAAAPFVAGGIVATDANGNISSGIEDYNDAGTPNTVPNFSGTCTSVNTVGRCQLALTSFSNGLSQNFQFAAYPSSGGTLLLEVDSFGLTQGAAYVQSATSFAPDGYGLDLSGFNFSNEGLEFDDIAQFNATSATTSNMTGILDENDLGGPLTPAGLAGTYTPDSPPTGRGMIAVPNINNLNGTLNLEYYVVDSSTAVFIDVDGAQIGVGTFEVQSASSSPSAAVRPAIPMVRPMFHAHAASRRK